MSSYAGGGETFFRGAGRDPDPYNVPDPHNFFGSARSLDLVLRNKSL
jgi:hypothetical protein